MCEAHIALYVCYIRGLVTCQFVWLSFTQCCFDLGLESLTLAEHQNDIRLTSAVCCDFG